jgi:TetR/AcrR family transcriptional regulator, regulator of autoinduction and epiphytic fitness
VAWSAHRVRGRVVLGVAELVANREPGGARRAPPSTTDGRRARGERTRRRVAEALVELLEEGNPQPTAKQVAEKAGVSLRLVFHHFDEMEALYRAVAVMQFERHWQSMGSVKVELPLADRIEQTARLRAGLFEAVTPVRRAAVRQSQRSEEIAQDLAESNRHLREQLANTFAPEIASADVDADLLDELELIGSWESWERLRTVQHLSTASARRVMAKTMVRLLVPAS